MAHITNLTRITLWLLLSATTGALLILVSAYLYLSPKLPSVDVAIRRVAIRIAQGGHAIPEDVIRRRFKAGWRNFSDLYRPLLDIWRLYDNSDSEPVLLEEMS